jgi:hypothetical protein
MGAVYRRVLLALALSLLDIAFALGGSAHVAIALLRARSCDGAKDGCSRICIKCFYRSSARFIVR